eukprot:CAMPEP_0183482358 /NCGR_PEP_ID=MMETSP0370-20130417/176512_1 /TAXON_ID=268820 /ORGANISM="Peridinium aciculiferum, Strain PAER-2" /LENGTH=71 /DNA_ID=CAMNT_0025675537 /DNA_START=244 /DNA_END=459 /DNA_ORIENTATION=-
MAAHDGSRRRAKCAGGVRSRAATKPNATQCLPSVSAPSLARSAQWKPLGVDHRLGAERMHARCVRNAKCDV